jgi:antitoxin Phd
LAIWKLEDAKNRFSELVRLARRRGPQVVTRHGREAVVVLAVEDYRRLARQDVDLVEFLRNSPLAEALASGEFQLTRARDMPRDIEL